MKLKKGTKKDIMINNTENYKFAVDFATKIFNEMIEGVEDAVTKEFIENVFENYICIGLCQEENKLIDMDVSSQYPAEYKGISKKISNIRLNLKDSILAAIEVALSSGVPESKIDFLKLALLALTKLYVLSTVELTNAECLLLLYLHKKNAYDIPVSEKDIFDDISKGELNISREEYMISIRNLNRLASVIMVAGEILLKEKITLHYN